MENSFLRCEHISRDDWGSLQSFTSAHSDGGFLADYIKENAFLDEEEGFARTYIVRDRESNDVVAYFSLKSGFVAICCYILLMLQRRRPIPCRKGLFHIMVLCPL